MTFVQLQNLLNNLFTILENYTYSILFFFFRLSHIAFIDEVQDMYEGLVGDKFMISVLFPAMGARM
jgi:hypothetical protein